MSVYSKLSISEQKLAATPLFHTPTDSIVKLLLTWVLQYPIGLV